MKRKTTVILALLGAVSITVFTSETPMLLDSSGKLGNCGGTGEATCSAAGCHGAGSGGLADNAGPGSIAFTASPTFVGNAYVPNQVYQITVTVAETGKSLFGFSTEFLNNSGNTNIATNDAVGTITITNSATTRKGQVFGIGRLCTTHKAGGGASANMASFTFNWTAPASGIVNVFYDGIAANSTSAADAGDNVYSNNFQLSVSTSISENSKLNNLKIFPNPVKDNLNISFTTNEAFHIDATIVDVSGKFIAKVFSKNISKGTQSEIINVSKIPNGIYFLMLKGNDFSRTEKIIIAN